MLWDGCQLQPPWMRLEHQDNSTLSWPGMPMAKVGIPACLQANKQVILVLLFKLSTNSSLQEEKPEEVQPGASLRVHNYLQAWAASDCDHSALTKATKRVSSSLLIYSTEQRVRFFWQTSCNSCTILSSRWLAFRGAAVSPAPNDFAMRAAGHSFPSCLRISRQNKVSLKDVTLISAQHETEAQGSGSFRGMEAGSGFTIFEGFSRVSVKELGWKGRGMKGLESSCINSNLCAYFMGRKWRSNWPVWSSKTT